MFLIFLSFAISQIISKKILVKFQQTLVVSALSCRRLTLATVKCERMLGDGEDSHNGETSEGKLVIF